MVSSLPQLLSCLNPQVWRCGWRRYLNTYVAGIHRLFLRQKQEQFPGMEHDFQIMPARGAAAATKA